ncbi:MAG: MBL fold metallo-hydrolase [Pseudomonadota bacterium]
MTKISYPWDDVPDPGTAQQVADGILWLRLPLPMALDHVNVYALDDGDGWTLVDTGMKWGKVPAMWDDLLAGPLGGKPVVRIIGTHHHPDHIGYHGFFMDRGAELMMTRTAYLMGRMLTLDRQDAYTPTQIQFYQRAGMRADLLDRRKTDRPFNFADIVHPLPLGFTRLDEGLKIQAGGRDWTVHIGNGHAPGHATLWTDDVVLTGDQIIPSISSNIGVYPTEPDANPLADWLESCERLAQFATGDQLALPGHKRPFRGLPLRLKQLLDNHHGVLDRLRHTLQTPKSAGDVFLDVFKRPIGDGEYGLALVEALAHCNYLWHAGDATRVLSDDGKYLFKTQ